MAKQMEVKGTHPESPAWLWARIRAVRNYKVELSYLESCLLDLKHFAEIEKRNRKIPDTPRQKFCTP